MASEGQQPHRVVIVGGGVVGQDRLRARAAGALALAAWQESSGAVGQQLETFFDGDFRQAGITIMQDAVLQKPHAEQAGENPDREAAHRP